jgi:phospho-N-acetylmuramoyl-pentapeptide-transferase
MITTALALLVLAFLALLPWGHAVVAALLRHGIGKNIRYDGPATHQLKSGTATMGGLYFLAGLALFTLVLVGSGYREVAWPFVGMVAYGALGAFDDWQGLRDKKEGVGWLARTKFWWQWGVALAAATLVCVAGPIHVAKVPLLNVTIEMGAWLIPITTVLIVYSANAVNITDGQDGLAAGTAALAFAAFGVLGIISAQAGLAYFCFATVGVLAAFLWYNVHPARMFMGDTGSQALGAGLALVAVMSGYWLFLPIIGALYVAEILSVMIQVSYFKYTRRRYGEGRRIFRMAPLHHHFELGGWPEVQITLRFWLVAAAAAAIGVALGVGG